MAAQKMRKPPPRDAVGGSLKVQCLAACTSEISTHADTLQQRRAAWIARRCAVPDNLAILLASLAFERRAAP